MKIRRQPNMQRNKLARTSIHGILEEYAFSMGLLLIKINGVTASTLEEAMELVLEVRFLLPCQCDGYSISEVKATGIYLEIANIPHGFTG